MASIHPSQILLLTILSLTQLLHLSTALGGGRPLVGGWKPIKDLNDPTVVEIATFAVDEHNKETKESLTFQKVVSGESQVVSGTNFKLTISATSAGDGSSNYEAQVYDVPWLHTRKLTSFKKV